MGFNRGNTVLALGPEKYRPTKTHFWKGTEELERFPPSYNETDEVFEEYLGNRSLAPSRHQLALRSSSGLMELHYETMRKKAKERAAHPVQKKLPSMDRAYTACAGYSGLIPGKISNGIVGCSWQEGSRLAFETTGRHFKPPMSGLVFTMKKPFHSASLPSLDSGTLKLES